MAKAVVTDGKVVRAEPKASGFGKHLDIPFPDKTQVPAQPDLVKTQELLTNRFAPTPTLAYGQTDARLNSVSKARSEQFGA